jgi:hypothetical protein
MEDINSETLRRSEHGSAFTHCSARGMAKLAALMANHGTIGQEEVLNKQTWDEFHSEPKIESWYPTGMRT